MTLSEESCAAVPHRVYRAGRLTRFTIRAGIVLKRNPYWNECFVVTHQTERVMNRYALAMYVSGSVALLAACGPQERVQEWGE